MKPMDNNMVSKYYINYGGNIELALTINHIRFQYYDHFPVSNFKFDEIFFMNEFNKNVFIIYLSL